ncbi:hypothetical protein MBRA1_001088 [Malassezia brasiliensis]|uniref:Pre-rRNA-processing protein RIX1 N-terminal domain-containing protein n=1 Tax=Malassezia brasiliensis TaxID=1821822 RepID=A0AAF0IS04_9BASI|nr:hypothetical protein MBRA1_001088 [Malassezia brasiliensis]
MATLAAVLGALEESHSDSEACRCAEEARACNTLGTLDADARKQLDRRLHALLSTSVRAQESHAAWAKAAHVADVYLEQAGWAVAEEHGAQWIQKALTHAEHATSQPMLLPRLLPLLTLVVERVMGRESTAHPEYYRVVVAPNVPKLAATLVALAEAAEAHTSLLEPLLQLLLSHLGRHPSVYRPHAAPLHALCMRILFGAYVSMNDACVARSNEQVACATAQLLAALHLTGAVTGGNGKVSQAQLWLAPLTEMLDAAFAAVNGSVPSQGSAVPTTALGWTNTTQDYTVSIPAHLARVLCLAGDETHTGVLVAYLTYATPRPVPVPVGRLLALAHAMVRAQSTDAKHLPHDQLRAEYTVLPQMHRAGLRLFAITSLLFETACWRYLEEDARLLDDICALSEAQTTPDATSVLVARVLAVAFTHGTLLSGAIPGAGLVLDPASMRVQRMARLAIHACTQILLPTARPDEPATKRARQFESDTVALANRLAQDRVLAQGARVMEWADAGLALFLALFGVLSCSATPGSRDLARTGALVVVGLVEALLESRLLVVERPDILALAQTAVRTLVSLVVNNHGALVAYVLLRTRALLERGAQSPVPLLRAACEDGLAQTTPLLRPRAPPVFDSVDSTALETQESDVVPLPRPAYSAAKRGAEALDVIRRLEMDEEPMDDREDDDRAPRGQPHVPTATSVAPAAPAASTKTVSEPSADEESDSDALPELDVGSDDE